MIIDLVFEARISGAVSARLSFNKDRATVRHDKSCPNQEHARLTERDLAVIDADQTRSLRDELGTTSWGIENVFCNLRCNLAGKIRANTRNKSCRNALRILERISELSRVSHRLFCYCEHHRFFS